MNGWFASLLFAAAATAAPYNVTIYRDTWGVPHIYGRTDADAVYGLMYAQAEDNFWQLEESYIRALGRQAEAGQPRALAADFSVRLFESVRRAREEYGAASPRMRALYDAFAAGVNRYLDTHPEVKPRLIARFEPWFILALQNAPPPLASHGITSAEVAAAHPELRDTQPAPADPSDEGSNMWAVAPRRTAAGRALLLINPHVGFFGGGQRYEAHLHSNQGLDVSGFAILGTPYIRSGHNRYLGWSHTNNYADTSDAWIETFEGPLTYRYGAERRTATEWRDEIRVNGETRSVRLLKTHHGPVVAVRGGRPIAVRTAHRPGLMEQRWAMAKARSWREFQAALAMRNFTGSNTIYADAAGNIFYVHGNAIPRRAARYDWSKPVEGADPETEWQGLHEFSELPQFLNPPSGWLQNCNSTVFQTTEGTSLDAARYPAYMVPERDTLRAQRSREILAANARFTFDEFARAAPDTKVVRAAEDLPKLLQQTFPAELEPLAAELRQWDYVARSDSVAATLFLRGFPRDAAGLERVKRELEKMHGTWRVPWGEVNRLQRVHTSGTQEPFSDEKPSLPSPGCSGMSGCLFAYTALVPEGQKRGYGTAGNTYVAVVEFGKRPRAVSIVTFGQSADPQSPHYLDQAPLYVARRFKPAWFEPAEIRKHSQRVYRP